MASPTQQQALDRAISAYQAGHFIEAEKICQQIISGRQDCFEAVYVLAVVQAFLGKHEMALANYDRALVLRPDHAEAFSNRGNTLKDMGRHEEALVSYDRSLKLRPDNATTHSNRGNLLLILGRLDEALAAYDRALALKPDHVEGHYNRGNLLLRMRRLDDALASYDRAIKHRPNLAEAFANRGAVLKDLGRLDEALQSYDRAIALRPNLVEALCNRGSVLNELKRLDEALKSYERALAIRPDHAESLYNRGHALHELKRYEEALASYDRAIAAKPNYPEAHTNRGATLYELMRHEEALASYERAIAIQPDYPEAHWNNASLSLLTGNLRRGFEEYEWRWVYKPLAIVKRNFPQPLWLGTERIGEKTILLHCEQGFGDTIQFCRYAPLAAARGARVILEVPKPLVPLMQSLAGAPLVIARNEDPLPPFDLHCPLMSLALAFGTRLESIPAETAYLRAPTQGVVDWAKELGERTKPRIGLAWSGNAAQQRDAERSMSLRTLLPLLDLNATFFCLQKDIRPADAALLKERPDILYFGDALDFSNTAALMQHLDVVISVDTSIAHLAGALGRPLWVLLSYLPDWRWLLNRDDSPWYPSARLFRQNEGRTWPGVISRVQAALRDGLGA